MNSFLLTDTTFCIAVLEKGYFSRYSILRTVLISGIVIRLTVFFYILTRDKGTPQVYQNITILKWIIKFNKYNEKIFIVLHSRVLNMCCIASYPTPDTLIYNTLNIISGR